MQKYIDDFIKHLKYERNASDHTLRNYESDLVQFYDHIAPPDNKGFRREIDVRDIHVIGRDLERLLEVKL